MSLALEDQLCLLCKGIVTKNVCLKSTPPILFFQLVSSMAVTPNQFMIILTTLADGAAHYVLKVIIYFGCHHFAIQMMLEGC